MHQIKQYGEGKEVCMKDCKHTQFCTFFFVLFLVTVYYYLYQERNINSKVP